MNWKTIIKRALAKFKTRPLEEYIKPVDTWKDHNHTVTSITTVKPQSGMSITGNITTGIHSLTTAQMTALQTITPISYNYSNLTGISAQSVGSVFPGAIAGSTYSSSYGTISSAVPAYSVAFRNNQNKEIVRLNTDGSVTWGDGATVDEAEEEFAKAMMLGGEICAGITYGVKQRIRDAAFEELIDMAKTKGSLTADDLTYMLQAAKMMDKLKGIK